MFYFMGFEMKNTFDLNQWIITTGRLLSKQITFDDFLTYDQDYCIDNINYSKKIYRITAKACLMILNNIFVKSFIESYVSV